MALRALLFRGMSRAVSDAEWTWITVRLPAPPRHQRVRALRRLSHKALAERCWAASVNADFASMSAAEWYARVSELVDMLDGVRPVDPTLLASLRKHRDHVARCRRGTCEHEYAALVRAGVALPTIVDDVVERIT